MTSKTTKRFWKLYEELPEPIRRLAVKNYRLWRDNPRHPSLDFKKLGGRAERFPFALVIIIAHWVTRSATALNGFGLARMRNTTSLWDNPLIDFSRHCGEDTGSN
jgi:hypothetical protein